MCVRVCVLWVHVHVCECMCVGGGGDPRTGGELPPEKGARCSHPRGPESGDCTLKLRREASDARPRGGRR